MAYAFDNGALEGHIRKTWKQVRYPQPWLNLPEIPNKAEVSPAADPLSKKLIELEHWDDYQKDEVYNPDLPINIIKGPWPSKEDYIAAHYQILREDAVAPLRHSVAEYKRHPHMMENQFTNIYTHVTFKGIQLSPSGAAFRVEFCNERAGKRIRWEQSKRLIQGSIVALSPQSDNFQTICKIAVIAARPISGGLDRNPPQVDIFWGNSNEADFDPAKEYVMLEHRSSYFEAYRHMLEAMQKLMTENFTLADHIVNVNPIVQAPPYVQDHPIMDLSSLIPFDAATKPTDDGSTLGRKLENVDVLEDFPDIPESGMDDSQMAALKSMLTKQVAIVQGPPGTGKTFVSVAALKVMLANLQPDDPPIIVSAQTNHALDQLLNHILVFEDKILRIGGRSSKENEKILERTLYNLKQQAKDVTVSYGMIRSAKTALQLCVEEIQQLMAPLTTRDIVDIDTLLKYDIISQSHHDLLKGDDWDGSEQGDLGIEHWLPGDQLEPIPRTPSINMEFRMEEGDIEQEQLRELEGEAITGMQGERESDREALTGTWLPFQRTVTGRDSGLNEKDIKKLISGNKSLHSIPAARRGDIYRYFVARLNLKIKRELRKYLEKYQRAVEDLQLAKAMVNKKFIRDVHIKLIGCTTTGLSKYRGLLAALQPRTILIEEAAETLEGTIISGMFDSLQQLILVGDHQQLQAGCQIRALEEEPYFMRVSMFERLVDNSIGYVMLNRQRRMIPEIRELLCIEPSPFYDNLRDHPSVLDRISNRPPIPGMGGRDLYFFHHNWPEARNSDASKYNLDEAQMVCGMFRHLILNGVQASQITILTFYNGQRKTIIQELKNNQTLNNIDYFNCFTVDSYQGEENDIILLSLVRSNSNLGIGFLDSKNRLVVALSRARRGMYIFGNALTLSAAEATEDILGRDPLWEPVIRHMNRTDKFDLDGGLPITCSNHNKTVAVYEPADWDTLAGGCDECCNEELECGHICIHRCHSFSHSVMSCTEPCKKKLQCGHGCSSRCSQECRCTECDLAMSIQLEGMHLMTAEERQSIFDKHGRSNSSRHPKTISFAEGSNTDIRNAFNTSDNVSNSGARNYRSPSFVASPERVREWNKWSDSNSKSLSLVSGGPKENSPTKLGPPNAVLKETYKEVKIRDGKRINFSNRDATGIVQNKKDVQLKKTPSTASRAVSMVANGAAQKTGVKELLGAFKGNTSMVNNQQPLVEYGGSEPKHDFNNEVGRLATHSFEIRGSESFRGNSSTVNNQEPLARYGRINHGVGRSTTGSLVAKESNELGLQSAAPSAQPTQNTDCYNDNSLVDISEPVPLPTTNLNLQAQDLDMFEALFGKN